MDQAVSRTLRDLRVWDTLSPGECAAVARAVAAVLPSSFQFVGVETHQAGSQQHHIARFEWQDSPGQLSSTFALIPGGAATLGYDPTQRPVPSEKLVREWMGFWEDEEEEGREEEKDIPPPADYTAFYAYAEPKLLPLRTATLQPFLIETTAQEASKAIPPPLMIYSRFQDPWQKERRVTRIYHRQHLSIPQRHVVALLKQQGFRLPTSDEWEYACSAGTRTLFYWGDWQFTEVEDATGIYAPRNAFGLEIANNPYDWEYCSDPALMRGGDGGCAVCGGEGELASWLPLASSHHCRLDEKEITLGVSSPWFRRVLSLAALVE